MIKYHSNRNKAIQQISDAYHLEIRLPISGQIQIAIDRIYKKNTRKSSKKICSIAR
jgi:hypothetical protein